MSESHDVTSPARFGAAKKYLAYVLGALAVVAVCVVVRWNWGPGQAGAQAVKAAPPATAEPAAPRYAPGAAGASVPAPASGTRPTATGAGAASPAPIPQAELKVMAVVNGEQITRQELANECLRRFGNDVVESMVNKYLILYACKTRGITITQQDVETEITGMASKFGLSNDRWLEMLQKERGIAPDQYRNDIVWPTLALRKLAAASIQVTPAELKEAMDAEFGGRVKARLISVSSAKKAQELYAKAVAKPDTFGDLAKEFSEDPNSAAARGTIPPIRRHMGDPEVEKAAFALKEGEISPVVHAANQYLILLCEKILPPTDIPAEYRKETEAKITANIRDRKLRTASTELFKKLQDEAKVENIYNNAEKQKQMPGIAAVVNGKQITVLQLADECLTRHAGEVLEGEINRKLLLQALKGRGQTVGEKEIDAEIARAAKNYGFVKNGKPDLEGWLKRITEEQNCSVDLYVRDAVWPTVALKKLVGDTVKVTDEDLKKGFESNYGERVEVLVCVLGSQRQAQQVWEQARNNPTEEFFGQLAQQYSIEPVSKANSGRVPPVRKFGGQPAIEKEAFALKRGELSGIVVVGDKYIVMRCIGRTSPVVVDFAEVKDQLHDDIAEKQLRVAMANKFDSLRATAQIDNFLAGTSQTGKPAKTAETKAGTAPPKSAATTGATGAGDAIPTFAPKAGVTPAGATVPAGPARSTSSGTLPASGATAPATGGTYAPAGTSAPRSATLPNRAPPAR